MREHDDTILRELQTLESNVIKLRDATPERSDFDVDLHSTPHAEITTQYKASKIKRASCFVKLRRIEIIFFFSILQLVNHRQLRQNHDHEIKLNLIIDFFFNFS